ncbi:MAG: 50S ribosomal protein L4 [Firmicutes bacterium]|nr:50S ribosomal protein L4 [Bacillota bacterium]
MPKLDLLNMSGEVVGDIQLNDSVFGIEVNEKVLHEVVKNYLANQRQGTHSAKTRAEVRGGGRKPFKQKGTGRARQGTISAPHYVGGGIAFAPKPRDYSYTLPKKVKRLAMKSALSSKVQNNEMIILDDLKVEDAKTKSMVAVLSNVKAGRKVLILTDEKKDDVVRSSNNIAKVKSTFVGQLNVYDILNHGTLVATKSAIEKIEEVYI